MTPEQKREQLLKRLLPALAITVIYFVFVSGFIGEQKNKAEDEYRKLTQKGISPSMVSNMSQEMAQIQQQLNKLTKKQTELQQKIKQMAGFIASDTSNTQATAQLAEILAANRLQVVNEQSGAVEETELPPAVKDIKKWLQPDGVIHVQRLKLRGDYLNMHSALQQIKDSGLQTLPVALTMKTPEADNEPNLYWELVLWM